MKEPEYQSPNSVGKRQTIPIDAADPRLRWDKKGQTLARSGAEIQIVSVTGGADLLAAASNIGVNPIKVDDGQTITIPAINNEPPKTYPGGSGAYVYVLTTPTAVTATWATDGSDSLIINFTWDSADPNNATASGFNVYLTDSYGTQAVLGGFPKVGGSSQTITLTKAQNISMFNVFTNTFTSIGVQAADPMNNTSAIGYVDPANLPKYVLRINPPSISVVGVNLGYKLTFSESAGTYGPGTAAGTPPTSGSWDAIEVWELETNTAPTITLNQFNIPVGWTRVYFGKLDPVNISTTDVLRRYVIARFSSIGGTYTGFCDPVYVDPTSPVSVNVKQPTEATVTASWSNNDILINYTLPGSTSQITNATGDGTTITYTANNTFNVGDPVQITGVTPSSYNIIGSVINPTSNSFQVAGTASARYVSGGSATATNNAGASFIATLVASNNQAGYFYYTPSGVSLSGTFKITANDLLTQFSSPIPSSFNILFQSVSQVGVKSNGTSIALGTRNTGLSTQIPLPTFQANVDGIVATFDFTQYNASYGEVYISYRDCWTPLANSTTPKNSYDITDFYNASYVSGGAINTNTITLNNFINEDGVFTDPTVYIGMPISGLNIPKNTFVDSISLVSSGTYQITLKKYDNVSQSYVASNFTGQASGQYTMQLLVWSGSSPANIFNDSYAPLYLTVRYVDQFGQESYFSDVQTKTPLSATTSLINTALAIQPGAGSIYLGTSSTSLPNVIIGSNNNEAGIFVWGPDSDPSHTTLNTNPSTSIIGDSGSNYTFVTTDARIADWSITDKHIQNDAPSGSSGQGYVGLSGSNSKYSIWAGSTTSDNSDGSAKFSVTPSGSVIANNLQIIGGRLDIGASSYSYLSTGTTNSTTLSVSSTLGLAGGMYVAGYGIVPGTIITSVGTNSVTLSSAPTSNITNGYVTFISQNGAHITGAGTLYATDAVISGSITATSGNIKGNLYIYSGGSLYTGSVDSYGNLTSSGYVLNTNGLYFSASPNGTANTYITSSGLTTTAANIGGWLIDKNTISKTGSAGISGTVTLDSSAGTVSVSAANVSGYTAGINGPWVGSGNPNQSPSSSGSSTGSENVFWAGTGGATSTANSFRVTLNGDLYASKAYISGGLIQTSGSTSSKNVIKIDATNDWISLGDSAGTSYLVTRNNNIYLTSPGTNLPWGGTQPAGTDTSSPTSKPYLAAGSSFKDYWNNTNVGGIGIFTGNWDYFSTGQSSPFITATTTGLQLSAAPGLGMLLDGGTSATGSKLNPAIPTGTPSLLIYTSKDTSSYSPSTTYGAWMSFTDQTIKMSTGISTTFLTMNSNNINLQTVVSAGNYIGSDGQSHSQPQTQSIGLDQSGLHINGLTVYGNDDRLSGISSSNSPFTRVIQYAPNPTPRSNGNTTINGGDAVVGFAVYYGNHSPVSGGATTGFIGDLWVQF